MRRRVIAGAFFDNAFALTDGSVRATSLRKRSSLSDAECFAFTTERSIAERLAGIRPSSFKGDVVMPASTLIPPIAGYFNEGRARVTKDRL